MQAGINVLNRLNIGQEPPEEGHDSEWVHVFASATCRFPLKALLFFFEQSA